MPLQPPTRPHSANPTAGLKRDVFQSRSMSPVSTGKAAAANSYHLPNSSSLSLRPREAEWEDAWDSSSDKEEEHNGKLPAGAQAIPIRRGQQNHTASSSSNGGSGLVQSGSQSSTTPASWTSSFQHVSISPSSGRPALPTSKTFTEGAKPPLPGTEGMLAAAVRDASTSNGTSKLPPGGSWELVEPPTVQVQVLEEEMPPQRAGPEAVRDNVADILNDPFVLLGTLDADGPATPAAARPNATTPFNFLSASIASSSSSSTRDIERPATPSRQATSSSVSALSEAGANGTRSTPQTPRRTLSRQRSVRSERRRDQFLKALRGRKNDTSSVDIAQLRTLSWSGIPDEVRPIAWQLLLNYLPSAVQPRLTTLHRKRKEYAQLVDQYFSRGPASLDQQIWHQIVIDVPRTRPGVPLWACSTTQRSLERILYVWAIRHPASGYVQGINDLVTPFFEVFLSAYIESEPESFDPEHLPDGVLAAIEADSFWCLSKLLDGIQDNYISHQPGIHRLVKRMYHLVQRIDAPLALHFEEQGVEFMQFAFRWMNCLLMREMSVRCTIRMWDTYLSEGTDAFSQFHLYVCSALLTKYSASLKEMDFQEIIMFLQRLPTQEWTDHDVELLLSEAYVLKAVWQGAENHFAGPANGSSSGGGGGGFGMLGR